MKQFIIYGDPYGKVNMRPVTFNGHQSLVQPRQNTNYMSLVRDAWFKEHGDFKFNDDAALVLVIEAYYSIPKSVSKKKRESMLCGIIRPTKKPDCDNISKVICDSLNKIAFRDDSAIVHLLVKKFYGETPRVEVGIGELWEDIQK